MGRVETTGGTVVRRGSEALRMVGISVDVVEAEVEVTVEVAVAIVGMKGMKGVSGDSGLGVDSSYSQVVS